MGVGICFYRGTQEGPPLPEEVKAQDSLEREESARQAEVGSAEK